MNTDEIKTAFQRQRKTLTLRPGFGQGVAKTKATIKDGLTCEITEGNWSIKTDMSNKWGGENAGPNPGVLGRGTLGSCLAIGYKMWAAELDVPIDEIEVEVETGYDSRGMFGMDGVPPGYVSIKYIVRIKSPADDKKIMELLETSEKCSDYLNVFRNQNEINRKVEIIRNGD